MESKLKLEIPATFISHKRGQRRTHPNHSLLRIPKINTRKDAEFFLGNAVVSIYELKGVIMRNYGRISRLHGNNGVVAAKFAKNLPPKMLGKDVFIKLYKVDENDFN